MYGYPDISLMKYSTCRIQNSDIPRAGRIEAHGGVAGQGRAELFANRTVRLENNPSSHFPKH